MWRRLRLAILLCVLVFVALGTWLDHVYTTNWNAPLGVAVYPVAADDAARTREYVASLSAEPFHSIEQFFAAEGRHYGLTLDTPVRVWVGAVPQSRPPLPPQNAGVPAAMLYSLKLRLHAWRTLSGGSGPTPHIRMYLLYHDPALSPALPHSLGLERGLVGVVHLFADPGMAGSNAVVLAHEILHTLGARDKYRFDDGQPEHPAGYAEPDRDPLYPQTHAELMGGRIPISASAAEIPTSLASVVIGPVTASEIGWTRR
jgi:hypothetical protein